MHPWIRSLPHDFVFTPLHVAMGKGNFAIVNFLLTFENAESIKNLKYLIHYCVAGSHKDSFDTISQKNQILQMIQKKYPDILDSSVCGVSPPLLESNIHVKLIGTLIGRGDNVNAVRRNGCVLHKVLENDISPECFHQLMLLLFSKTFNQANSVDSQNRTPLHAAVQKIELMDDTVQIFHLMHADFNAVDKNEDSVLFYAIRGNRNVKLLEQMVSFGVNLDQKNSGKENLLHVSVNHGNISALEYFLNHPNVGAETLIAKNKGGLTPLVQGLSFGKGIPLRIIKLMEDKGLTINAAIASEALKGLFCNKIILVSELDREFVSVAEYMIEKGGVVTCRDGKSPWDLEAITMNVEAVAKATDCNKRLLEELKSRGVCVDVSLINNKFSYISKAYLIAYNINANLIHQEYMQKY